jgi:hypothetical protein
MYYLCHDIDDLINEFIQYVENKVSNKKDIIYITYSTNSIYIYVFVPLSNYAVDEVEALYDAPSNYINDTDEMRAISKHVLINQDYQIMIQQQFRWNLVDKTVARGEDSYTPTKGMPNPHIQGFGCWGNNKSLIQKALADARLIIALEQSISAIRGINVSDSAVMKRWRDYMLARRPEYTDTPAFKNMETGELLNLQQFMDQITERENNNNVETDQPELVLTDDEGAVPPQL